MAKKKANSKKLKIKKSQKKLDQSHLSFSTFDPFLECKIQTYNYETWSQVQKKLELSYQAFLLWRNYALEHRCALVIKVAKILREHAQEAALIMAQEMGKPIKEALSEIEKCAWSAEILAKNAGKWLKDEEHKVDGVKHLTVFQPLGPILGIMPWNYPFWQVFRFVLPTILAGNTVLVKHADNVTGCALLIEWIFQKASFPHGIYQMIICDHSSVAKIIRSNFIQGVSLTGSVRAGSVVGAVAGESIKRTVMELGGTDPFIVLEDANIKFAAKSLAQGRFGNCGQSCVAPKRAIIYEKIYDQFVREFLPLVKNKKCGDPRKKETEIGPMVNSAARKLVHEQVQDAIKKGAKVLLGGKIPKGKGTFYLPTILANVTPQMRVFKEEVFGPVALLMKVKNEVEILCLAYHSDYGLGSSIWTKNLEHGEKLAREMSSGLAFVNSLPKSDPHVSFGGIKKSGLGHELGILGIRSFTNQKNLSVYASPSID